MIGVELCAGTLCVGLTALAGRIVDPITGFMGSKRRWRQQLAESAYGWGEIDQLIAVDSGPWGDFWNTVGPLGLRADVERLLLEESREGTLPERWPILAARPPSEDPAERAAQFVCLQARSASCIPIWWDGEKWAGPTGSRTLKAQQRHKGRRANPKDRRAQCQVDHAVECHGSRELGTANRRKRLSSGLVNIGTLADRVAGLAYVPLDRLEVITDRVQGVEPIPGSRVLFDPPYVHSPRYEDFVVRDEVLELAGAHAAVADRVLVCEGEPLPLEGWHSWRLEGRREEWVTSTLPQLRRQLRIADLLESVA